MNSINIGRKGFCICKGPFEQLEMGDSENLIPDENLALKLCGVRIGFLIRLAQSRSSRRRIESRRRQRISTRSSLIA